jgi:energy-coupling factor transporter ATP-binding protein EcfA2
MEFIANEAQNGLSEDEIRLLNIIRNNFDDIVESGTASGKRAKLLTSLISKKFNQIPSKLDIGETSTVLRQFPIKKITKLKVANFRGFKEAKEFEFDKLYTLVYGPNGSGKSSLCEALEYSLLGYIDEAIAKRIDINEYIKNADSGIGETPILKAINLDGFDIDVIPESNIFNFCFIEKNRIANFGRISSKTPANQIDLLSALFGIDEFNAFVAEFTDNFENYIGIAGNKNEELKNKRALLAQYEDSVKTSSAAISEILKKKEQMLMQVAQCKTLDEFIEYIYGDKGDESLESEKVINRGRLWHIDNEIMKPIGNIISCLGSEGIRSEISKLRDVGVDYKVKKDEYEARKEELLFKQLYLDVLSLEEHVLDKCPACDTPLKNVIRNPYEKAKEGLTKLAILSQYENELEAKQTQGNEILENVINEFKVIKGIADANEVVCEVPISFNKYDKVVNRIDFMDSLNQILLSYDNNEQSIKTIYKKIEKRNQDIIDSEKVRAQLHNEKQKLQSVGQQALSLVANEKVQIDLLTKARKSIATFEVTNKTLIEEAKNEEVAIRQTQRYATVYASFMQRLKNYKNALPLRLLEDLNELTTDFYNTINNDDEEFEKAHTINLPSASGEVIKISFANHPETFHNALHILSEGHIRCLGLAILLAKIVLDGRNVIIFDDVVNAIDDEHRDGVRELLFKDERLKNRQIILTSHAEEFIKDLDNQFSNKEFNEFVKSVNFLRPLELRTIRVDTQEESHHYVINAKEALSRERKRECLTHCRQAIENINDNLLKKLNSKYNAPISVQIRHPNRPPETMSKVCGLRKSLEKNVPQSDNINKIVACYKYLEGLETANKNVWAYLNKGVHEESGRVEFDTMVIKNVLGCVDNLDVLSKEAKL